MNDFYVSDLLVQEIPAAKFYWQNLLYRCAVGVRDSDSMTDDPNQPVTLYFYQAKPDTQIFLTDPFNLEYSHFEVSDNETGIFRTAKSFQREQGKVIRPEKTGKILNRIFDLLDQHSWSFPRASSDKVYISDKMCGYLEKVMLNFLTEYIRNENPIILAVDKAGTLLADRLGIRYDGIIKTRHYNEHNTQNDSLTNSISVDMYNGEKFNGDRRVLVIDDLVSSGRTAKKVSEFLLGTGFDSVTWIALYRTVSSQEVDLSMSDKFHCRTFFPLSNAFWVWGRGFDLNEGDSRSKPDIYASQKHWDDEIVKDVTDLVDYFGGDTSRDSYLDRLLP